MRLDREQRARIHISISISIWVLIVSVVAALSQVEWVAWAIILAGLGFYVLVLLGGRDAHH